MALTDWSTLALPQFVQQEGYSEAPPNLIIKSQPEQGVPKFRRRCSAGMQVIPCVILCTDAQVTIVNDLYSITLLGGSVPFTWKHPRTQAACTMFMLAPPVSVPVGTKYATTLSLGILP